MDRELFIRRIVPLRQGLMAQALRLAQDSDAAEDLVQETMLRLWALRDELDRHPNAGALARTILRNRFTDEWRHQQQEQAYEAALQAEAGSQGNTVETADQMAIIRWIVEHLPPLQQQIFRMKEMEGYEAEEIIQLTGCSPEALRQNLSRARRRIREDYIKITARRKQR